MENSNIESIAKQMAADNSVNDEKVFHKIKQVMLIDKMNVRSKLRLIAALCNSANACVDGINSFIDEFVK